MNSCVDDEIILVYIAEIRIHRIPCTFRVEGCTAFEHSNMKPAEKNRKCRFVGVPVRFSLPLQQVVRGQKEEPSQQASEYLSAIHMIDNYTDEQQRSFLAAMARMSCCSFVFFCGRALILISMKRHKCASTLTVKR